MSGTKECPLLEPTHHCLFNQRSSIKSLLRAVVGGQISTGLSGDNQGGKSNTEAEKKAQNAYDSEEQIREKEIIIAAMEKEETSRTGEDCTSDRDDFKSLGVRTGGHCWRMLYAPLQLSLGD
ncbi:hypothetical protein NDU88_006560 [Pleurodeles waltl]|uniref:Uncharacterized protein n=1 Tax=Pleurodeles waltl TaxID=8319 RepID=A0AAV7N0R9_PLEWA|nr:hypothetical protein NDU88_006560 [Pleurodeles waltl]